VKVWTKICGITRVEDAIDAARLGANAVGINFHVGSPRCCAPHAAAAIVQALAGSGLDVYGVFVREVPERIVDIVTTAGLSGVQLHGGETDVEANRVRSLLRPGTRMIRAVRVTSRAAVAARVAKEAPWRLLLDSPRGGGSGTRFDVSLVAGLDLSGVIVAGGLTPENVGGVVARLHPYGVDTASGVEREKGIKDRARMREFIENANAGTA